MGNGTKTLTREGGVTATFSKVASPVHTARTGPLRDALGRVIQIVDFR